MTVGDDLVLLNYYTMNIDYNFTNVITSLGIEYDKAIDIIIDISINRISKEFLIITNTYRLFSIKVEEEKIGEISV